MRFEVKYPESAPHEVELQGTLAVLGRDPSCDLVLNDVKCSRRHAVVEAGPDGIAIRDTGSANGVYVNGKKVERANLRPGDVVSVGDVTMTVLAEDVPGTLVMGPEEAALLEPDSTTMVPSGTLGIPTAPPPRPKSPPPPPPPPPRVPAPPPVSTTAPTPPMPTPLADSRSSAATAPSNVVEVGVPPTRRPLTVTILAALWGVSVLLYGVSALGALITQHGWMAFAGAAVFAVLALLSGAMAFGLFAMKGWARVAQIVVAALGILNCPFTLAAIATLVYMLRADAKTRFGSPEARPPDPREGLFAALVLGTVLLGGLAVIGLWALSAFLGRQTAPPTAL